MKLLFFNDFRLGVFDGDSVIDVSGAVTDLAPAHPQELLTAVITRWSEFEDRIRQVAEQGPGVPLDTVRVRPPVPRPLNIDCMARNYMEGATERPPVNGFPKTPHSIVGHGDQMVLPDIPATVFEGEAELAVVIGRRAHNVSVDEAMDHVFGYTNLIDGSARGIPPRQNAFYQMKSRETFCPIGPFLVTADEVPDPQNLPVRLWTDGNLMQDFNTDDMAYSVAESIAFVSSLHTLEPGDLVATGTTHGGLHPLMDGDVVELEVGGLGRLRIDVRDDLRRTWKRETRHDRALAGLKGSPPQLSGKYTPETVQA
ncbi:fumarylacetoacetate hydrolase family protein [Streptomyces aurantiacus]|uniref:2-hydroxyhepta-2,4-diene-1,7-dioate isomerase n=1 Tax=Streptomyces aurantiacus TaxID=47760 RepID=A0A7G1P475_9ACTN|nr:fumarylacetoacetate hydrolase family protein [Streptomyces aurantiacus]BCL28606.1 2-hydroxyhepta-2,4-diene-1,7-dioate isomerase [Streptomyces aurantiacus]